MNIDVGIKIHNRFDIEVKDVITGEIVQRGQGENIVLNSMFTHFCSSNGYAMCNRIYFGKGAGTLSKSRTSLFSSLGYGDSSVIETVHNIPPTPSYAKRKIVIGTDAFIGETLTEVGVAYSTTLLTHALIKDAEGNLITIDPKTDTQEITIYSTIFAEVMLPDGVLMIVNDTNNELLGKLTHSSNNNLSAGGTTWGFHINLSATKTATVQNQNYMNDMGLGTIIHQLNQYNVQDRKQYGLRSRFASGVANGKIWSINTRTGNYSSSFRILFPNSLWAGYHFVGKSIGIGNGNNKKFNLPWSDINTTKEYKIYVDGALKTKDVDYTLANSESETSVTFTNAPANGLAITGDWWVDYIPKDSDHVLDITFTITFGEGA